MEIQGARRSVTSSLTSLAEQVEAWCASVAGAGSGTPLPAYLEVRVSAMRVSWLADLVVCEQVLDALAMAGLCATPVYLALEEKAALFLRATPGLILEPWLRTGGAVHDLIERIAAETSTAEQVLRRFRLRVPSRLR